MQTVDEQGHEREDEEDSMDVNISTGHGVWNRGVVAGSGGNMQKIARMRYHHDTR